MENTTSSQDTSPETHETKGPPPGDPTAKADAAACEARLQNLHVIVSRMMDDVQARGDVGERAGVGLIIIAYNVPADLDFTRNIQLEISEAYYGPSAMLETSVLRSCLKQRSPKAAAEALREMADRIAQPKTTATPGTPSKVG